MRKNLRVSKPLGVARVTSVVVLGLWLSGCAERSTSRVATPTMPLRMLRLYETGVGYFERTGPLPEGGDASLVLPSGHLDDALKSLVVLGPNGDVRVDGVAFGSRLSREMARTLAGFSSDDEPVTYASLVTSLVGATVSVETSSGAIVGKLVHVESVPASPSPTSQSPASRSPASPSPASPLRLTLVDADSRIVRVEAGDVRAVRPTDPSQAKRLDAALDALLARGPASQHRLHVFGAARTPVTLGYVAETPVWRTNYRVVVDDASHAVLQGWALVHNDTDEDWQDVRVELVNGRPDSFLFPLAAPRYARRELVTPEHELSTVPQLVDRTVDSMWSGSGDDVGGLGLSGIGEGGGGYGIGLGRIGTVGHGAGTGTGEGSSSLLSIGNLAAVAEATGQEQGVFFVYRVPRPLALHAHASELVPFLQQPVVAEPMAWIDEAGSPARQSVRFVNSTTQTLPAGTMAFFLGGRFAGEAAIDRMLPGTRAFVTFGADLDADAREARVDRKEQLERARVVGDALEAHYRRTTTSTWTLENRGHSGRTFAVRLHVDRNGAVTGADGLDFDTASNAPIATFQVGPKQTLERRVVVEEGIARNVPLAGLSTKALEEMSRHPSLDAATKAAFTSALPLVREAEAAKDRRRALTEELGALDDELRRLREDAEVVRDRGAASQPLVARMLSGETRKSALNKEISDIDRASKERVEKLRAALVRGGIASSS